MLTKTLITQSYVLTEVGKEIALRYSLVCDKEQFTNKGYGIHIEQEDEKGICSEMIMMSANKEDVLHDIHFYAKNFVFPVSLHDIIEDAGLFTE